MAAVKQIDPVTLAQALIRCPSVTPEDHGALGVLERALTPLGFSCHRLRFEDGNSAPVDNLYARLGQGASTFLLCRAHRCRARRASIIFGGTIHSAPKSRTEFFMDAAPRT